MIRIDQLVPQNLCSFERKCETIRFVLEILFLSNSLSENLKHNYVSDISSLRFYRQKQSDFFSTKGINLSVLLFNRSFLFYHNLIVLDEHRRVRYLENVDDAIFSLIFNDNKSRLYEEKIIVTKKNNQRLFTQTRMSKILYLESMYI